MEAPEDISREIGEYLEVVGCPYEYIEDRGQAIQKAIREAKEKTVLLVLGKGNEARQKYGKVSYKFPSDGEFVRIGIQEYNRKQRMRQAGMKKVMMA